MGLGVWQQLPSISLSVNALTSILNFKNPMKTKDELEKLKKEAKEDWQFLVDYEYETDNSDYPKLVEITKKWAKILKIPAVPDRIDSCLEGLPEFIEYVLGD